MAGSGRFNFDDGGSFCGGWYAGMAEGYAVCSGPYGQGVFEGSWSRGFEVSGVYKWPDGDTYEGQWKNGMREGVGVEHCGEVMYRGEWTRGCKYGYGIRQKRGSISKYEGAWSDGLYDGYGIETYGDGGTFRLFAQLSVKSSKSASDPPPLCTFLTQAYPNKCLPISSRAKKRFYV